MTRTYYDIFGVSRSATREEIRTAYIALIKRYHPDVSGITADSGAREMVASLNRCYAVLRDPRKRAQYDAQLVRESVTGERRTVPRYALITATPPLPHRPNWGVPLLIAAAAGIAVVAQLGWQWMSARGHEAASLLTWPEPQPHWRRSRPLPVQEVATEARLATTVSTDDALAISRRCFDDARAKMDLTSVKLCIIFDDAFLYWRQNANGYEQLPIYFGDEATRMRHLDALAEAGEVADRELSRLRDITFRALLAQLTGHRQVQTSPSPAPESDGSTRTIEKDRSRNGTGAS